MTSVAGGLEPTSRLLRPSVDDRIRGFGYSAQIAAALIALCDRKGMREGERTDGGLFFAYRESPARGRGKQLVHIDLPMDGKSVHLKFARGLLTDFSGTFPGIRLRLGKRGIPNNCRLTTSGSIYQKSCSVYWSG